MSTEIMSSKKNNRSNASMAIINEYNPKNAGDMQDALKDISDSMLEACYSGNRPKTQMVQKFLPLTM